MFEIENALVLVSGIIQIYGLSSFLKYFYLHSVYLLLVLLSATVKDKVLKYL